MAFLSGFPDVSEENLDALIQKVILEKTKIEYGIKNFKGKEKMNLKYQFDSFIWRIVAGVSVSVFCIYKFNNCLSEDIVLLSLQRFLLKRARILLVN